MQQHVSRQPELSREELLALKNKRTGLAIFQASWILVFVSLSMVNLSLRSQSPTWPPPGVAKLDPLAPTAMTLALLLSGYLARQATQAVKEGRIKAFLSHWRAVLGLGLLFVAVMVFLWVNVPSSGQYSTLFRVMVGYHIAHALAIGVFMWRVYRFGQARIYGATNFWAVEAASKLWYFVIVAWLIFYVVLYWI